MNYIYLSLGSNLGDRISNLREAIRRLSRFIYILEVSSIYESEPFGFQNQSTFLNMSILGMGSIPPENLLEMVKRVEGVMGRNKPFPNAPRIIDIDILIYGELRLNEEHLKIPHPGLFERKFMFLPAIEIASRGYSLFVEEKFSPSDGWITLYSRF